MVRVVIESNFDRALIPIRKRHAPTECRLNMEPRPARAAGPPGSSTISDYNHLMNLRFTKMHGLGNDFMVVDRVSQGIDLDLKRIRTWSDRRTGIGSINCWQCFRQQFPTRTSAFEYSTATAAKPSSAATAVAAWHVLSGIAH